MKYVDRKGFFCFNCGHLWLLVSNRVITLIQYWDWVKDTIIEHTQLVEGKDE